MPNNETGNQTGNDIQHKDPITVNDTTTRPSVPSVPSTLDSERVDLLAYGYRWLRAGTPADDPERVAAG